MQRFCISIFRTNFLVLMLFPYGGYLKAKILSKNHLVGVIFTDYKSVFL